ncbi:MAG: FkbM family methyltransferase [Roseivirga sp.]|nr:FkbM family methyltransferase [Roseivirga sp.]
MVSVNKNGLQVFYREGTADEGVLQHSFEKDIFFKGMPEYQPRDGHCIIDIGAHIGTFSLLAATTNKIGKIYAIEPCLDTYSVLEKNILENRLINLHPHRLALSDKKGTAKLFYDTATGNWGHSLTHAFSAQGEEVPTDTLDAFFEENDIEHCHFIKFNCEGSEFDILLQASSETLARIDNMLVLYHMDLTDKHHVNDIIKRLKKLGFYTEKRYVSQKGKRGWLVVMRTNGVHSIFLSFKHILRQTFLSAKSIAKAILKR